MILDNKRIDAVIFDMDGVLIDSEPLWKISEISTFKSVGVDLKTSDLEKTVGLRIDEVVDYWFNQKPWSGKSKKDIVDLIMSEMVRLIQENGQSLKGVLAALSFFKSHHIKIGLATSSYQVLLEAVLAKLSIAHYFDYTLSAETLAYGKPHPEVYLLVAKHLNVAPENCLVIEDSLNGVISGKAAKMTVIAVPEKSHTIDKRLILADYLKEDLNEVIGLFS
jgi:sugar-phosphatase